ncbi:MAG: ATPase, partial [Propionibacteriaceae bacterium]|nr:ATPase [Propionibacteriaceae bacterium]
LLKELCGGAPVVALRLASDQVTSFLGAFGCGFGVVVAGGTGAVTFGVGPDAVARVDGWGALGGDAGGGFWIGRAAFDHAMRAHDGRGPQTRLTSLVAANYSNLDDAYMELFTDPDWVRSLAALAQSAIEMAETDEVAAGICAQAGQELALSCATAVARAGLGGQPNPPVCLLGGVLKKGAVRSSFLGDMRARWPEFEPRAPLGASLDGAKALGGLPASHPLCDWISIA